MKNIIAEVNDKNSSDEFSFKDDELVTNEHLELLQKAMEKAYNYIKENECNLWVSDYGIDNRRMDKRTEGC